VTLSGICPLLLMVSVLVAVLADNDIAEGQIAAEGDNAVRAGGESAGRSPGADGLVKCIGDIELAGAGFRDRLVAVELGGCAGTAGAAHRAGVARERADHAGGREFTEKTIAEDVGAAGRHLAIGNE